MHDFNMLQDISELRYCHFHLSPSSTTTLYQPVMRHKKKRKFFICMCLKPKNNMNHQSSPTDIVTGDVLFCYLYVSMSVLRVFNHEAAMTNTQVGAAFGTGPVLIVNLRNNVAARSGCCLLMRLKVLIFRGNALIYIKGPYIFPWPTFSPPLSALSHPTPPPRYMFHVLKNSIAPSPLMQARHLDRLEPRMRRQWIKEWRSLRGGGTVKRSKLSAPPSPTLDSPADIYPQSPVTSDAMMDEFALNVISKNCLRT